MIGLLVRGAAAQMGALTVERVSRGSKDGGDRSGGNDDGYRAGGSGSEDNGQ